MIRFVIYTPTHGDYLSVADAQHTEWVKNIDEALMFRTVAQAEPVARQFATAMKTHTDPYRIFIREMKQKNGVWRMKHEIEILPQADRQKQRRETPEAFGQELPPGNLGLEIAPVKYVICNQIDGDYLSKIEEIGDLRRTKWALHPEDALIYETQAEAEMVATSVIRLEPGSSLLVCELHRTKDHTWINSVQEIFINTAGHSLN